MTPTHIVWDWNGTLLDDLHCCVGVANQLLDEFGLEPLDGVAGYQAKFRFPIVDYYADLGFDCTLTGNFDAAARRYMSLYGEASRACTLHQGAAETIQRFRAIGMRQAVITASKQSNVDDQISRFPIKHLLDDVRGISNIYAASKAEIAHAWMDDNELRPNQVVFIGDSEHDYEIAAELGSRCLLFSGGHHARDHLASLGAPVIDELPHAYDALFSTPRH